MVAYNLEHLTQNADQWVGGPIQDDEALLLFAVVKCMRIRSILEIGGLGGYSAVNFLKAMEPCGRLYTVDINPVPQAASNHVVLTMDCRHITRHHIPDALDLVFYDCHIFEAQMAMHDSLVRQGIITERTIIALHDTNLHPGPIMDPNAKAIEGGYVHQAAERMMVNVLRNDGWEALMLHTTPDRHDESLRLRHGLTLLSRPRYLPV